MADEKVEATLDDRAAIYEKWQQEQQAQQKPEPKKDEPISTDAPAVSEASGTQPVKTEEASPAEKGVREGQDNKPAAPETKTVPHEAFHAEREKRKAYEARVKELEDQQKTLLDDLKTLTESKAVDQPIEDYDKAINELRREKEDLKKEIASLKSDSQKRSEWEKEEAARKAQDTVEKQIADVSAKLEKDGFPGFSKFKPLVVEELRKRVAAGEPAETLDTPEGWMKVYRESVFPTVHEISTSERFKAKEEKKKEANLALGSGGGTPKTETKEEPWDYKSYMKMRESATAKK